MVLALHAKHLQQVNIGRACEHQSVNDGVAREEVVGEQWVSSRYVAVDVVVVNAVAVCVILPVLGCAHLVVKTPRRLVVGLDGRLHGQRTEQYIRQVAVETLYVLVGIGD